MVRRTITQLTKQEIKKLNSLTIGYGNLAAAADTCEMRYDTLKRIIKNGYGLEENVIAIRQHLLEDANITA